MLGRQLAHYEILGEIGRGGMGEVYVARDGRLDREVALKVLPAELADDAERLARFEREAKTLASINHPNIVTIYSVEEADGIRFMTMELVRGSTLDEHVPDGGMEMAQFLRIAEPLADAVAAAHDRGIHHRDLKPANVMVSDDGRVKVLDFGLAKLRKDPTGAEDATQLLSGGFTGDMTAEGKIVGTIAYMSPEQAQGGQIDHRSDIFSLGILLYEMVSGKRPFDGPNNISVLSSILKDDPISISDVRDRQAVPLPLARIIHRALAKRPDERYQSARDLKQDLSDLRADLASGDLISGVHSGVHTLPTDGRGRLLRAGLMVGGAIVVGAILMWTLLLGPGAGTDGGAGVSVVASRSDVPSVAVLPFENLTGDDQLDWLRHGLPEMLVTDLSQAQDLRVVGNDRVHSIMARGGMEEGDDMAAADVQAIGREAGVGMVVLGAFVRAGGQLRIDARVQDSATSEVLASERVSGSVDDIFALVDELTGRIRDQVGSHGMSEQMMADMSAAGMGDKNLSDVTTTSVEAYRLYADAQTRLHAGRPLEAVPLLERAVGLDDEFGMAWAKLSVAYGNSGQQDEARDAARRAFELSGSMPLEEQLYVRGRYYSLDPTTVDESIAAYERAAELFPNNTAVRNNLGIAYMNSGRIDEAAVVLAEAIELGSDFVGAYENLARAYSRDGRLEEAIDVLSAYVEANPGAAGPRAALATMLADAGRIDAALEQATAAVAIDDSLETRSTLVPLLVMRGDWSAAEEHIAALEQDRDTPGARALAYQARMLMVAHQGRITAIFEILEEALAEFDDGTNTKAQMFALGLGLAQEVEDPDRIEALADRLEAADPPPGVDQTIPISRTFADAVRGDADAARAHALEFYRMIQGIQIPEAFRNRIEGLVDGLIALGEADFTAGYESLLTAWRAVPEYDDRGMSLLIAYQLGRATWEMGRTDEAVEWFTRADEAGITKGQSPVMAIRTLWYLGEAAANRGDDETAREHFERFVYFWGDGEIDRERVTAARDWLERNR